MKNHEKQLENFIYYILSRIDLQIYYQNSIMEILLEFNFGYIIRIQFWIYYQNSILDISLEFNFGYIISDKLWIYYQREFREKQRGKYRIRETFYYDVFII